MIELTASELLLISWAIVWLKLAPSAMWLMCAKSGYLVNYYVSDEKQQHISRW